MDFLQVEYFMSVMEHRSFTKVARALYTSQSNISKQISKLEAELEIALFDRSSFGVSPTAAGEHLYDGLLELRPKFKRLIEETKAMRSQGNTKLRIGFCDSIDFDKVMQSVFTSLKHNVQELNIQISAYPPSAIPEGLAANDLDAGIIFSVTDIELPGVKRYPLNRANSMIYFSKKHPLYKKKKLELEDFADETFLKLDKKTGSKDYQPFACLPFVPKKIITVNSMSSVLLNIDSCNGVAVFGQSQNFLGKESLATLKIDSPAGVVGTDIVWLSDNRNPALECFLEYIYMIYTTNA